MARLDVFVCDKCRKQSINNNSYCGSEQWMFASFTPVLIDKGKPDMNPILLCPNCVRDIREPYPQEASK